MMATATSLMSRQPRERRHERTKRVLVVHRFPVVRFAVIKLVEERLHGIVVAEAGTVSQALRRVRESEWDLVLMGLSFGRRGGLDLLKAIKELRPTLRVLVLTAHSEAQYARRCFRSGATGFVTQDSSRAEVVDAIQAVMSGVRYVSPRVVGTSVADLASRRVKPAQRLLSDRELEVMRLLAWGKTVGEIASRLSVSERTVSAYRRRVLQKLAVKKGHSDQRRDVVPAAAASTNSAISRGWETRDR